MEKCKKMAVLVGCNYPGIKDDKLRGCHNDVDDMRKVLITRFRFNPAHIEVLMDKPENHIQPTGGIIKKALHKMINQLKEGDILFFHFSGHGTLIPASKSHKQEEAIVACDLNIITSIDFRYMVNRVPKGASFTISADSCHSGGLIDKETEQIGPSRCNAKILSPLYKNRRIPIESILQHLASQTGINSTDIGPHLQALFGSEASLMFQQHPPASIAPLKPDEGILLSACQADEGAVDEPGEHPHGAFTGAVLTVLKNHSGPLSNKEIVLGARKVLAKEDIQHPCLYCSDQNADGVFLNTHEKVKSEI